MKKISISIISVLINLFALSQVELNFLKSYGNTADDVGRGITINNSNDYYNVGNFIGTLDFADTLLQSNSSENDIYIARFSSTGNLIWAERAGGTLGDLPYDVVSDNDGNCYITGYFRDVSSFGDTSIIAQNSINAMFLAKYDSTGIFQWVESAGISSNGAQGLDIQIDNNGNCYITGIINGISDFGSTTITSNGNNDGFVAKYNTDGDLLWVQGIGGSGDEIIYSINIDDNEYIYFTGVFTNNTNIGGYSLTNNGSKDIFIGKLNSLGNILWVSSAGGTSVDYGRDIVSDFSGNCFVVGYFGNAAYFGNQTIVSQDGFDIFLASYNSNGQLNWVSSIGGEGLDYAYGLSYSAMGALYLTGRFDDTLSFSTQSLISNGGSDIFFSKYDLLGNFLWAESFGSIGYDAAINIDVSETGTIALTGYFQNTMTIDTITVSSNGGKDIFVASFEDNNINYCGVPNSYFNTSINYTEISIEPFYPYDTSLYFLSWQMGDGTEFYQMTSVQYDYQAVDTFNIILTVQDKNDSLCFINLYDLVVTACFLDVLQISSQINGTNVELETSYFIDTSFWSISWDLGDGAQFFQTNSLQYNYQQIDTFVISLFIEDNNGSICSINLHDTIITTCLIDDLDFSMQRDSTNVSFDTSYFLDTTEYQIIWDFGDSTSITNLNNPVHLYNYCGYKTITLSVVYLSDGTCNNQIQKTLNVDSIPCIQSAEIVIYENVWKHAIFELLPNVDTVNYNILWNLGDGTTIENQYLIDHVFPYTNVYNVTCQLSHKADSNCILIVEKEIDLECYNDIGFDYQEDYITWPYNWFLDVWAYQVDNEPPNSYAVTCNCGTGGNSFTIYNNWEWYCSYYTTGNYQISLSVYDLEDSTCFGSYGPINLTVEEPECNVYAAIGNVFLSEYDSMTVIVQGGGSPEFSYWWSFGDGTSGGGYEVWHTYSDYGVYEICLTATNTWGVGCSETTCYTFTLGTPGCIDTLATNYNPNADFNNGSCIYAGTQSISLPQGWSIFSSYIEPYENNIDSVFQEIVGNTVLVKNQIGLVYYPQYSITLLDTLALGQGYQVKMASGDTLNVTGIICNPQNSPITLQAGWSIIGYLLQSPVDISQIFSIIAQNTEIVKDDAGNVFWPQYSINNIGNMLPGKGYQVKMINSDVLVYLGN